MAKRRTLNYRELRSYDDEEGERRKGEEEGEEEVEDEDEDEEEEAAEAEADEEEEADEADEEEEAVKKPPKKKAPAKPARPKRTRAGKVVRLRVVWGVFNNSNQRVATFDYNRRAEAEEHAAKLSTDKKQTYFIQPVKEPIEEK